MKAQIGLEITENNLNFAVVARPNKRWQLLKVLSVPRLPGQEIQALLIARQHIAHKISDLIIGIPYTQVIMKEIQVANDLGPYEIYQHLKQQIPLLFGQNTLSWRIDFEPIPEPSSDSTITLRVIACSTHFINLWQSLCKQAGFRIRAVDVDVLALTRLAPLLNGYQSIEPQGLIWLKKLELFFLVIRDQQLRYVKCTRHLGTLESITQNFQQTLQFFFSSNPQDNLNNTILIDEIGELNFENFLNIHINKASINENLWKSTYLAPHSFPLSFCCLALGTWMHGH